MVLLIHGCAHSARNFWPESEACRECRGLPEQLSHTLQAMRRGYAGAGGQVLVLVGQGLSNMPVLPSPFSCQLWLAAVAAPAPATATAGAGAPSPMPGARPTKHTCFHSFPAVISVNSVDTKTGCWGFWEDCYDVRDLMLQFLKQHK